MKTSERHHLKDNELALALGQAQQVFGEHQRTVLLAVGAVVIALVALGGFFTWRGRTEAAARTGLAAAMVVAEAPVTPPPAAEGTTPTDAPPASAVTAPGAFANEKARFEAALPKFLSAADAYPSTEAGVTARYHAAATLLGLGRFEEAVKQFDQVSTSGSGLVARMARLGKAEAQLRAGQTDAAIAGFKELADAKDASVPPEAALMELARAYRVAGKTDDAKKTLTQIVEQHADSPFATEAKQLLESGK
jgi:tetratricopeptide (TPR) repeat protein